MKKPNYMTPVIILDSRGKVLYCREWPEDHPLMTGTEPFDSFQKQQRNRAIANGISFKSKKDEERIKIILFAIEQKYKDIDFIVNFGILYPHTRDKLDKWKMEPLKPYDVPSGIEIEIKEERISKQFTNEYDLLNNGLNPLIKHFAFIKSRPKEETETQDELWGEVFRSLRMTTRWDLVKEKFRIERIK